MKYKFKFLLIFIFFIFISKNCYSNEINTKIDYLTIDKTNNIDFFMIETLIYVITYSGIKENAPVYFDNSIYSYLNSFCYENFYKIEKIRKLFLNYIKNREKTFHNIIIISNNKKLGLSIYDLYNKESFYFKNYDYNYLNLLILYEYDFFKTNELNKFNSNYSKNENYYNYPVIGFLTSNFELINKYIDIIKITNDVKMMINKYINKKNVLFYINKIIKDYINLFKIKNKKYEINIYPSLLLKNDALFKKDNSILIGLLDIFNLNIDFYHIFIHELTHYFQSKLFQSNNRYNLTLKCILKQILNRINYYLNNNNNNNNLNIYTNFILNVYNQILHDFSNYNYYYYYEIHAEITSLYFLIFKNKNYDLKFSRSINKIYNYSNSIILYYNMFLNYLNKKNINYEEIVFNEKIIKKYLKEFTNLFIEKSYIWIKKYQNIVLYNNFLYNNY